MCKEMDRALASVASTLAVRVENIRKYGAQVSALLGEWGDKAPIVTQWDMEFQSSLEISRADLPKVRQICGRLRMNGKHVAGDFDETGEIKVTVRPMSEAFSRLSFTYRTKLRGTKCHVVETRSSYKSLVCKA